ncbi:hypothetical protein P0082_09250 [Candidatus Haliotispira prima]|uniref:Uncharacterized protein n=1 Tax=Candidatus Haliotispira prima TaxID=3034016 RepID=A0ABY8MFC0_9SPIO|nr:hypothetical protein P0082_09250 [Candidatus Haliotispira prima]
MENPEGRTWRIQTLALLWKALDNRENEEQQIRLIQQAIANHNAYRQHFPEEAAIAVYLDRIEGVAHYVEVVAALRSSYQEIQSMPDRIDAYALLLQTKNVVDEAGIVAEAYALGVAAGKILSKIPGKKSS